MERVGLDTGFFIRLFEGNEGAVKVWEKIVDGELVAITSSLVLFELKRIFHKLGKIEEWDSVREAVFLNCEIVPVDVDVAEKGADISHGTGLPAVDALIYTCVKDTDKFYTTDGSFEVLMGKRRPLICVIR